MQVVIIIPDNPCRQINFIRNPLKRLVSEGSIQSFKVFKFAIIWIVTIVERTAIGLGAIGHNEAISNLERTTFIFETVAAGGEDGTSKNETLAVCNKNTGTVGACSRDSTTCKGNVVGIDTGTVGAFSSDSTAIDSDVSICRYTMTSSSRDRNFTAFDNHIICS